MLPAISKTPRTTGRGQPQPSQLISPPERPVEHVDDWTPHDVAEWLYTRGTKDDYAHTFLVKGIDGPALMKVTDEQLQDWKLKQADIQLILKGVADLRRLDAGRVGWSPGAYAPELTAPAATKPPTRPSPRSKQTKPPTKPRDSTSRRTAADALTKKLAASLPGKAGDGGFDAQLDRLLGDAATSGPDGGGAELSGSARLASPDGGAALRTRVRGGSDEKSAGGSGDKGASAARSSFLHTVMGELHGDQRVPLWKEEMVERVKRRSNAAHLSQSAPSSARLPSTAPRRARPDSSDAGSTSGESTIGRVRRSREAEVALRARVGVLESKVFWYQDAVHEQHLQSQLVDAKQKLALDQVLELEAQRVKRADEAGGKGALGLEKAAQRKRDSTARKLKSSLAINEERVADALKVNTLRADNINQLRRGRKDFMIQMRKLDERDRSTVADMKHFAQGSNVSLDEKEKFEAKLKRHLFEYSNEVHSWEHTVAGLDSEISSLDTAIKKLNNGEEAALEAERRAQYMQLKRARDGLQKRELRLGYLQNQVRGQEMDFQRLHRIMGVKFLPEKPESVQDIISASLKHEERNTSLLGFVTVQNQQLESLHDDLAFFDAEEQRLATELERSSHGAHKSSERAHKMLESEEALSMATTDLHAQLACICPAVEQLFALLAAKPPEGDGGLFALKGCRPDTIPDYLRALDIELRDLHGRAMVVPGGVDRASNARLAGFTREKVVDNHPSVLELRKELEAAAQKQAQAKHDAS